MSKNKFFVVWKGKQPGIYSSWEECKRQVHQFEGALFKGFATEEEAKKAFESLPWKYIDTRNNAQNKSSREKMPIGQPIMESISVDAACSGNPGLLEYRGVYTKTGKEIFHQGPFRNGTNNIGEFLAIVHALALMKQNNSQLPLYSDSRTALKWVQQKKAKTKLEKNEENKSLFELIERAENWLQNNDYSTPLLKWETEAWGEIPADFGRK
ncbi:MAG TPA: ribonuclease H family protein [Paludibacteraceae bacterium]|nr:ribonuclease H family protein [Paludibacteraceae bacterium]HOL29189.1 ribonuclease H family protein [Paludibacteraceae bacterium]HPD59693.1 ribonuclease H family protein [Paludibacteraceae bacterium]